MKGVCQTLELAFEILMYFTPFRLMISRRFGEQTVCFFGIKEWKKSLFGPIYWSEQRNNRESVFFLINSSVLTTNLK